MSSLLGLTEADRIELDQLVVDQAELTAVVETLRKRIGTFPAEIDRVTEDEFVAIAGYRATLDDVLAFHRTVGIPAEVSRATFADFGRVLSINRDVHGRFGAEVHRWLGWHWAGSLYQLGRLQYALRPNDSPVPGDWVLDLHIPAAGQLTPALVDDSLAQARAFFPQHVPDMPVHTVVCTSWLLDPYLLEHLPPDSNMSRFARRFTPYAEPRDVPGDAIYFTFRTRDMDNLTHLPRDTTLQRLVLDRIHSGDIWQVGYGFLQL